MIVSKHMSAPPITVSHDTDYKTAMGLMQKHRIRRIPVIDAQGALAGIVAERDLLVAADHYLSSPVDVAQVMTRQVVTVGDETPVVDAATIMIERKIGGLPVVDGGGRLLGIITETDLFKVLASILKRTVQRHGRAPAPRAAGTKRKPRPTARGASEPATRQAKGKSKGKTARKGAHTVARKTARKAR
jgi:acetoin utilization protein AcuB